MCGSVEELRAVLGGGDRMVGRVRAAEDGRCQRRALVAERRVAFRPLLIRVRVLMPAGAEVDRFAQRAVGANGAGETDRDTFVIRDHRQPVLPHEVAKTIHFLRFAAQVDLAIDDTSSVEILAERSAVRTTVGGEHENGIECDHPKHPDAPDNFEFRNSNLGFFPRPPEPWPQRNATGKFEIRNPKSEICVIIGRSPRARYRGCR